MFSGGIERDQRHEIGSTLLKNKRLWHRCFPVNSVKFLRTPFFYRTPPLAASVHFPMKGSNTFFNSSYGSIRQEVLCEKGIARLTGKHLCWSL